MTLSQTSNTITAQTKYHQVTPLKMKEKFQNSSNVVEAKRIKRETETFGIRSIKYLSQ